MECGDSLPLLDLWRRAKSSSVNQPHRIGIAISHALVGFHGSDDGKHEIADQHDRQQEKAHDQKGQGEANQRGDRAGNLKVQGLLRLVADKRRKSIRNIRKITRTMELIATARFKKAMDRASAATAYTNRITQVVADLAKAGLAVSHPLLEAHPETKNAILLVLTANRGLCGGYNGSIIRAAVPRLNELRGQDLSLRLEVSGKRGIAGFKFRKFTIDETFRDAEGNQIYVLEDQPRFVDV